MEITQNEYEREKASTHAKKVQSGAKQENGCAWDDNNAAQKLEAWTDDDPVPLSE